MIDSTNLDEIRRITRETIDELKVGNPKVYDEIGKSKYFDEVYQGISNPVVSRLENLGLASEGNIAREKRMLKAGVSDENIIKVIQSGNKPSPFIQKKILSSDEFCYLDKTQRKAIMSAISNGRIDVSKWSGDVKK